VYDFDLTLDLYDAIGTVPTRLRTVHLTDHGHLPYDEEKITKLHELKQEHTERLNANMAEDDKLLALLSKGKEKYNLTYAIASNASDAFIQDVLTRKNIAQLFDSVIGGSIARTKPHPMMYIKSMVNLGVSPQECIVVEDSNTGLVAAYRSGAYVYRVNNPDDVNDKLMNLVGQMQ